MKKYIIFFCFLLLGWSNVCFGGDATPSEIFPGYIQEKYTPESLLKDKIVWKASFGESMKEVELLEDKTLRRFVDSLDWLRGEELNKEGLIKIQKIVNLIKYVPEIEDSWQTISQFLDNGGDCEEFAIAKATIIRYFFPEAKLYFVLVYKKFKKGGEQHALTVIKIRDEVFVLDFDRDVLGVEECDYFIPYLGIDVQSGEFFTLYPKKNFHGQIARAE